MEYFLNCLSRKNKKLTYHPVVIDSPKTVLELPIEVLIKIFAYVPNKVTLKLVCWDFRRIVYRTEHYRLLICDVGKTNTLAILLFNSVLPA